MDGKPRIFSLLGNRMEWLGQRQKVLAQNIANADSPSYRAQDLTPLDFKRTVQQVTKLPVAVTEGNHLSGILPKTDYRVDEKSQKDVYEASPNGNGVVLEEQMIAVQDTKLQYDLALNLYNKQIAMFRTALGGGGAR